MRLDLWRLTAILTLVATLWGGPLIGPQPTMAQAERVCAVSVISVVIGSGGGRNANNTGVVLGGPEGTRAPFLSLGRGGTLVVQLGGAGASADGTPGSDLFVYESGTQAEFVFVSLSTDGTTYVPVGSTGSQASGIDLDAAGFALGTDYLYVQVQDDPNQGSHTGPETGGADIDAICGFNVGNASPSAVDDTADFDAGDVYVANVLTNDSDPDGDPLTVESFTQPADGIGAVSFDDAGNATFVPTDADYSGEVVFTYTVIDGQGGRATATVTLTIGGPSPSPSASPSVSASMSASASASASESASTSANPSASESALASASDSAEPSGSESPNPSVSPSPSGPASIDPSPSTDPSPSDTPVPSDEPSVAPSPDESVAPSPDESVAPSPNESVAPSPDASVPEPVPSTVSSVVLFDGTAELPIDGELAGDLSTLIDNPNGLPISFAPVDPPANGEVVIDPGGGFSYLPFTGFGGPDAFTFSVILDGGQPAVALVTVAVAADCSDGIIGETGGGTPVAVEGADTAAVEFRPCAGLARTGPGQIVSGGATQPVDPAPPDPGSGNGGGGGTGDGGAGGVDAGPGGSAVELPNTGTGPSGRSSVSLVATVLAIAAGLVVVALVRRRLV